MVSVPLKSVSGVRQAVAERAVGPDAGEGAEEGGGHDRDAVAERGRRWARDRRREGPSRGRRRCLRASTASRVPWKVSVGISIGRFVSGAGFEALDELHSERPRPTTAEPMIPYMWIAWKRNISWMRNQEITTSSRVKAMPEDDAEQQVGPESLGPDRGRRLGWMPAV